MTRLLFLGSALLFFASAGPGASQETDVDAYLRAARSELQQKEEELAALRARQEATRKLVEAGVPRPPPVQGLGRTASESSLAVLATQIARAEQQVVQARQSVVYLERRQRFDRPVDVDLRNASVRQISTALSRASGLPIVVDPGVPRGARVTLAAHQAPFSVLVGVLARRLGLIIAPRGEGVVFKRRPFVEIDGRTYAPVDSQLAPWSAEWGQLPGTLVIERSDAVGRGYWALDRAPPARNSPKPASRPATRQSPPDRRAPAAGSARRSPR